MICPNVTDAKAVPGEMVGKVPTASEKRSIIALAKCDDSPSALIDGHDRPLTR